MSIRQSQSRRRTLRLAFFCSAACAGVLWSQVARAQEPPAADKPAAPPEAAPPEAAPPAPEAPSAPAEAPPPAETAPPAPPAEAPPAAPPTPAEVSAATTPKAVVPTEPIEITVAGTPLDQTAGSAHVISKKQLERFEYDDVHAALSAVPGVYVRNEDGMGLRLNIGLRGVNPDRSKKVTLMEDGVLFGPAPYSAPAAYFSPMLTRMSQLRVIKGPGAVSYGPATIGGAIDFVTRPIPSTDSGGLDLAVGQYAYRKGHAFYGSTGERTSFLIEGVHLANDGFKELPSGADTGFYRNEVMFKGAYDFSPHSERRHEVRLKLTYSEELSNETYLGLSDADFRKTPLARYAATELDQMRNHRTSVVLTHVLEPARNVKVTTDAYRHDFFRVWRKVNAFRGAALFDILNDPDSPQNQIFHADLVGTADSSTPREALLIGPNQRDFINQGVQTRLDWAVETGPLKHRVEAGLRMHHDQVERRHSEDAFVLVGGVPFPEGTATTVTTFNRAWTYAVAGHAVDAITWKSLTVTPGVRIEAVRSGLDDHLTGTSVQRWTVPFLPGVGAFYGILPNLGVLAGVYRGFTPPVPGSDSSIKPELSVNYEGGARFHNKWARLEAIGFLNNYQNLTDVCSFSSGCATTDLDRQFDAGRARIYGLEAFADVAPKVGPITLPLSVAYTLTRAKFLNSFSSDDPIFGNVTSGDDMPYIPRHQLTVTPGVEHQRVGGSFSLRYVSRMREEPGTGAVSSGLATDKQLTFDAAAYFQALKWLRIYASAINVLNAHDIVSRRPFGARPNTPRWVHVGAKVAF